MLVQHRDRTILRKHYSEDKLKITSIFRTLQGEMPLAGRPAVFLRLSGCNFGDKHPNNFCQFCDTNFQFDSGRDYSIDSLMEELRSFYHNQDILVITGGEPTLQPALPQFIKSALELFPVVQIETNGTQAKFFAEIQSNYRLVIVCSPKGNYKVGTVPKLSDKSLDKITHFRFLLEDVEGSPHYGVPEWMLKSDVQVYVSPIAVYAKEYDSEVSSIWEPGLIDMEATGRNYKYAAAYALSHNLRLSIQQHIFAALP